MFVHISWTLTPQWLLVRHSIYVLDSFERVLVGNPLKLNLKLNFKKVREGHRKCDNLYRSLVGYAAVRTSVEWILVISLDEGTRKKVRFCVL